MPLSLQDLTWKVVERDKISDFLVTILDDNGVHHLFSWHQVMAEFLLAHFEAHLISFLLLFMEDIHLGQIFGFHKPWSSENIDIGHTIDFSPLVVSSHCLILWECGETSFHVLLWVERPVEIRSLGKWVRNDLA